jgi:hypothetical protein
MKVDDLIKENIVLANNLKMDQKKLRIEMGENKEFLMKVIE